MKPVIALIIISLTAIPAAAQSVNVGSLFPVLTYPEQEPETVTRDIQEPSR